MDFGGENEMFVRGLSLLRVPRYMYELGPRFGNVVRQD